MATCCADPEEAADADRPRRGRPREFDRDDTLDKVMRLFWKHGYDGVSLSQIENEMGISKPSLYASFGNKEQLFLAALDRYDRTSDALQLTVLDTARSPGGAIRALLEATADAFSAPEPGIGCMILTGTIASHPDNAALVEELVQRRDCFLHRLAAKLERWADAEAALSLARCLVATMQGMALQAHDGASPELLMQIADDMTEAFLARLARTAPEALARTAYV